jgi:DNA-binding protein HU-beta
MNKVDLTRSAMERVEGLSRKDAAALIDGVFEDIQAAVVGSEPVKIPGFGQFKVRDRAARMARNPATGEQVKVPAKRVFKFLPAKALKEAVMSKRGARAAGGAKSAAGARKTSKAAKSTAKKAPARGSARPAAKKAPARKAAAKKTSSGRKTRR